MCGFRPASFHFTLPGQWDSGQSRQVCKKPQLTQLADLSEESWDVRGGRNGSRHLIFLFMDRERH